MQKGPRDAAKREGPAEIPGAKGFPAGPDRDATLLAWVIFGETLAPLQVLGCALVLAGIWLARRSG